MEKESLIGKTFSKKGIGGMIYIIVVTGFEEKGKNYNSDSYVGKQTVVFPNGKSYCQQWASEKGYFEHLNKNGELKRLR